VVVARRTVTQDRLSGAGSSSGSAPAPFPSSAATSGRRPATTRGATTGRRGRSGRPSATRRRPSDPACPCGSAAPGRAGSRSSGRPAGTASSRCASTASGRSSTPRPSPSGCPPSGRPRHELVGASGVPSLGLRRRQPPARPAGPPGAPPRRGRRRDACRPGNRPGRPAPGQAHVRTRHRVGHAASVCDAGDRTIAAWGRPYRVGVQRPRPFPWTRGVPAGSVLARPSCDTGVPWASTALGDVRGG
jgi:hypothetical protein